MADHIPEQVSSPVGALFKEGCEFVDLQLAGYSPAHIVAVTVLLGFALSYALDFVRKLFLFFSDCRKVKTKIFRLACIIP